MCMGCGLRSIPDNPMLDLKTSIPTGSKLLEASGDDWLITYGP